MYCNSQVLQQQAPQGKLVIIIVTLLGDFYMYYWDANASNGCECNLF